MQATVGRSQDAQNHECASAVMGPGNSPDPADECLEPADSADAFLPQLMCTEDEAAKPKCHMSLLNPELVRKLKPGDVLSLMYYGLPHKVVVELVSSDTSSCTVAAIHYGRPDLGTPNRIIKETFQFKFVQARNGIELRPKCNLCQFPTSCCYPPDVVVQRARSRLNEQQHSSLHNRASHFALWCKTQSPGHRPDNLVPIFLSESHEIHSVKTEDHLNVKCDSGKPLHGIVTEVAELGDESILLTLHVSSKDMKERCVPFVHQRDHVLSEPVSVVKSVAACVSGDELSSRIQLLENLTYKGTASSYGFCMHLRNPNLSGDEWTKRAGYTPPKEAQKCLTEKVEPQRLNRGDIIFLGDIYRVLTDISFDGKSCAVKTVQYCVGQVNINDDKSSLKFAIDQREKDAVLCVHNDPAVDCPLMTQAELPWCGRCHEDRITPENIELLKPGDVIRLRYYTLNHKIIVESVSQSQDLIQINSIHYGRPNLATPNRIIREIFTLKIVNGKSLGGDTKEVQPECWLCHIFPRSCCYTPDVVVQRARSRLNEQQHSVIDNRASHFVMWCKTKSSSHRPDNIVPISGPIGSHVHVVKLGAHLNFDCDMGKIFHGEVIDVIELTPSRQLLRMLVGNVNIKSALIVHKQALTLVDSVKVVQSNPRGVSSAELLDRAEILDHLVFRGRPSSYAVCLHLTNPALDISHWRLGAGDIPCDSQPHQPLCMDLKPGLLKSGDIFFFNETYRVVLEVQDRESQPLAGETTVTTLQFCAVPASTLEEPFILTILHTGGTKAKNQIYIELCVHNDPQQDCPVHGGGRDTPAYAAEQVRKIDQISKGCIISLKSTLYYNHLVVLSDPVPAKGAESFFVDVIGYKIRAGIDFFHSYEIAENRIQIDVDAQKVHTISYDVPKSCRLSQDQVVTRAKSRLGERQHNWQWNNDRDFARWCCIKHPSNREQCCVQISSAKELVHFERGHIKFLKAPNFYTHDAIMTECKTVEGCCDIVKIRLYENNHAFRTVRTEKLHIDPHESFRKVQYCGMPLCEPQCLDPLMNCTFLNADDDKMGWTGKESICGSRVTSLDFCYWLKTRQDFGALSDIQMLFGLQLKLLQNDLKMLKKNRVFSSRSTTLNVSIKDVNSSDVTRFDHIILNRKVDGKVAEVHFLLIEWDAKSCTGLGLTYEKPIERSEMGIYEFNGFLRVTGPGQLEKVVHNSELNWNLINAKFNECVGNPCYSLWLNNCEHFVNFLIFGRNTSLQLSNYAGHLIGKFPRALRGVAINCLRTVRLLFATILSGNPAVSGAVSILPDAATIAAEGVGLALCWLIGLLSLMWLRKRRADLAMPTGEYRERLFRILCSVGCATVGIVIVAVLLHTWEITAPVIGICAATAIGTTVFGQLLPVLRAQFRALFKP